MARFNKGDKVRCIEKTTRYQPDVGTIGVVLIPDCNNEDCLVQWPNGSTYADQSRDQWYCSWSKLQKVVNLSVHITTDGTTTHAVLKEDGKVIKRSKAVCSPSDEFDFMVGAKLALDRLTHPVAGVPKKETVRVFDMAKFVEMHGADEYYENYDWIDACHGQPLVGSIIMGTDGNKYVWSSLDETIEKEV